VDHDGAGSGEMEVVVSDFAVANVAVNGDMVVAHVGALACEPGVVALAGTGSSILGIAGDGRRAKVGGWGPIFGDEGSANGIAQDCLRAAAHCFDGRSGETALLDGLTKNLGLSDFSESVKRIYLGRMETREVAALCRRAYEIAANGDEIAIAIFRRAGEQLAAGVVAALRRLGMADIPSKVSYQGSVLESCTIVRERFSERLGEECPKARIMPPRFKPVIGAFLTSLYVLRVVRAIFWGPKSDDPHFQNLPDAQGTEWVAIIVLVFVIVLFGILPGLAVSPIDTSTMPILMRLGVI
jgi:N-acetylglucosamine kinase-like BadF-type ATPase